MSFRTRQTLILPDRRLLGFAEFGDPSGTPLVYFHGFPMSRLEGWSIDRMARRRRLRVIAPDRPGFGLSTFRDQRRITDWPVDVRALASHLGLERFAILGVSGGGPYAVACASALPREMLSAVGVVAGGPPWEAGPHYMPWFARLTSWAATYCPAALRCASTVLVGGAKWIATTGPVTRSLDSWLETLRKKRKEKEKEEQDGKARAPQVVTAEQDACDGAENEPELPIHEHRRRMIEMLTDGFAQGSSAFVQEAQLLSAPSWGFRFEDVAYEEIQIWHGVRDRNAPIEMVRYMAKRLPCCDLHEFKDDTHFTMGEHLEAALDQLCQRMPKSASKESPLQMRSC